MFTYEYASKCKKNLAIYIALITVKSVILDAAFLAACLLILLLI